MFLTIEERLDNDSAKLVDILGIRIPEICSLTSLTGAHPEIRRCIRIHGLHRDEDNVSLGSLLHDPTLHLSHAKAQHTLTHANRSSFSSSALTLNISLLE